MKKAKEFVADFEEKTKAGADDITILTGILQTLLVECKEIAEERKAKTNDAFKAILTQQEQKWKAILRGIKRESMDDSFAACLLKMMDGYDVVVYWKGREKADYIKKNLIPAR